MDFYTPLRFLQVVNEKERNLRDFFYKIRLVINYIKNLIFDKKIYNVVINVFTFQSPK